jgi:hypothetical protein
MAESQTRTFAGPIRMTRAERWRTSFTRVQAVRLTWPPMDTGGSRDAVMVPPVRVPSRHIRKPVPIQDGSTD